MGIEKALAVVNQMQAVGVIGKYAIGGAVGAAMYLEPVSTFDLDIFVSFANSENPLDPLRSIINYLDTHGHRMRGEYVSIEGWDVQFLPTDDKLCSEALDGAVQTKVGEVPTWVMSAEHLMAIALKTGRAKDFVRLELFIESKIYDEKKFKEILVRHDLLSRWEKFTKK
jgi:hypothetical protein